MILKFEKGQGVGYLYLQPGLEGIKGAAAKSEHLTPDIVIDYDGNGDPMGIEFLNCEGIECHEREG